MTRRVLALALVLHGGAVMAHGRDPEVVTLEESADATATVSVRVVDDPSRVGAPWSFALSPRCRVLDAPTRVPDPRWERWRWRVDCGPGGLDGVVIDSLGSVHETTVTVRRRDGSWGARTLRPAAPSMTVPARRAGPPRRTEAARTFLAQGVAHLATGVDHLLFLALLMARVRGARRRAAAVSAFTLGHAATLAVATLTTVPVSTAWVEALIAGSLWLLAIDVASAPPEDARAGVWVMPAAFGLVHGLGFAEGLRAAGLRAGERALALGAFNVGIELAQLAAVLAVVLVERAARARWSSAARGRAGRALVELAGAAGGWWLVSRVAAMGRWE